MKPVYFFKTSFLLCIGFLSACGSATVGTGDSDTSSGSSGNATSPSGDLTAQQIFDLGLNLFETYENTDNSLTPFSDLPTSGTGTYQGAIGVELLTGASSDVEVAEAVGELELIADFGNSSISGTVTNVHSVVTTGTGGNFSVTSSDAMSGGLTITNGVISNSSINTGVFRADIDGSVTDSFGTTTVDAELRGDFVSTSGDGDIVGGGVLGTYSSTSPHLGTGVVEGTFAAER